ncbi:MAG: hypothetical protein SGJ19_07075 [Planctomycetia bacterium]|nr:hypothetical protein [Planctomycetia bacterium]
MDDDLEKAGLCFCTQQCLQALRFLEADFLRIPIGKSLGSRIGMIDVCIESFQRNLELVSSSDGELFEFGYLHDDIVVIGNYVGLNYHLVAEQVIRRASPVIASLSSDWERIASVKMTKELRAGICTGLTEHQHRVLDAGVAHEWLKTEGPESFVALPLVQKPGGVRSRNMKFFELHEQGMGPAAILDYWNDFLPDDERRKICPDGWQRLEGNREQQRRYISQIVRVVRLSFSEEN